MVRHAFWPLVLTVDVALGVAGVLVGEPGLAFTLAIAATVALGFSWSRLARPLIRRLERRHHRMLEAARDGGDATTAERGYTELEEYYRAFAPRTQWAEQMRATLLILQHRWAEARALLVAVDRSAMGAAERLSLDNSLVWCLAHDGATAEAVELAERTCAAADAFPESQRAYLHGTLGAALELDGRHGEALEPLRLALALGGPKWAQAVRSFYLGESLCALRRSDEARAAWQRAVDEAPASEWGQQAKKRLETATPSAYR